MPQLTSDQISHISSLSQSVSHAQEIDEQTELARLAGLGDAVGLGAAMGARPGVNPGLAVAWAAENGELECLLMSMARFERGTFHPMAAALAAQKGRDDCLAALVAGGGDEAGLTDALRSACAAGQPQCVAILLSMPHGPNPDAGRSPSADPAGLGSQSALDWATEAASEPCQRLLIEAIAPRDPPRALVLSARHGFADLVEELMVSTDPRISGSEALYEAALHGRAACVSLLIPASNPLDYASCALRFAADNGHEDCVSLLLPHSNPADNDFESLAWASAKGHAEAARMLLDAASPSQSAAATCLGLAARAGHVEIAIMLARRCGSNWLDAKGDTALHVAMDRYINQARGDENGYHEDKDDDEEPTEKIIPSDALLRGLLLAGAVLRPNASGLDPVQYAEARKDPSAAQVLRKLVALAQARVIADVSPEPKDPLSPKPKPRI